MLKKIWIRTYEDALNDEIGQQIKSLRAHGRWTKEKYCEYHKLCKLLEKNKYIKFIGHPARYNLHKIGESYIYNCPRGKRGNLAKFAGKFIRIVVTSSGRFDRQLMAGTYDLRQLSQ
jgi:hypothetical protein